jgi:hypothetical protein
MVWSSRPMSRERVEGFLHACMMIGYRVHTKDSPLRAAQVRDLKLGRGECIAKGSFHGRGSPVCWRTSSPSTRRPH